MPNTTKDVTLQNQSGVEEIKRSLDFLIEYFDDKKRRYKATETDIEELVAVTGSKDEQTEN